MKLNIVGLLIVFASGSVYGQVTKPSDFIDEGWNSLQYFEGKLTIKKTSGQEPKENYVNTFEWMESIDGYFKIRNTLTRFGRVSLNLEEAYNGSDYALLDKSRSGSLCKVSKNLPSDVKGFESGICPLEPFGFLTKAAFQDVTLHATPLTLAASLKAGISSLNTLKESIFLDKATSSFDIEGNQGTQYRVFLAKDSHQLLGWHCYSPDKTLNTELVIENWQLCKLGDRSLRYPSLFTIRYFKPSQPPQVPDIAFEYACSFDMTKASETPDPSIFFMDPVQADFIYDSDRHVLIKIPR